MNQSAPNENVNLLLWMVIVTSFINPFMGAAINIALPDIAKSLSMSTVGISWVGMMFLLSSAVFLVPAGKIADIKGIKLIFLWGNIVVTVGSAICAIAISAPMLLGGRLVQGIGASMMFGTGMAIVTSAFPPQKRGRAIGMAVSSTYLGLTTAPVIGGLLTQYAGWRSLFYIPIPLTIAVIFISIKTLKNDWTAARGERFDLKGSLVYVVFMSILMYGFTRLPQPLAAIAVAIGLAGLAWFVIMQQKIANPVMNIRLFKENRIFAFSNLAALINYSATFAIGFLLSLYLQYIKGMTPRDAGFLLIAQPVFMTLFATVSGRLSDRFNAGMIASAGMSIIVIGLLMLYGIDANTPNTYIIATLIVLGTGFGIFSSPNTNAIMSSVAKNQLGTASATVSTMRLTGQMLSMGIATMILQIYLGRSGTITGNPEGFLSSMHISFILFAILCALGVFASMARHKK